jgi:hypothetical protein
MKTMNNLFLGITTALLLACSFGGSGTSSNKAEIEDRERFLQQYSAVFGVYEGTISNNPNQKVQVSIYYVDVPNGERQDGQQRMKPVAKARFRWLDSKLDDVMLDAQYIAETADIRMTNQASTPGGDTSAFVISGKVSGETITGVVTRNGGALGIITLHLVNRDSTAPPEGDARERNRRLRKLYQPLVGNYTGVVKFQDPQPETVKFYLRIYIDEQKPEGSSQGSSKAPPSQGGTPSEELTTPVLLAHYQRADYPPGELTLTMDCDYITTTTPPTLNMISRPFGNIPNEYRITMYTQIEGGNFVGTFNEYHKGRTGDVNIVKNKDTVTPPKPKKPKK